MRAMLLGFAVPILTALAVRLALTASNPDTADRLAAPTSVRL